MSAALYSGEILVRDPLADWFEHARYRLPVLLRSRAGYLTDTGEPNVTSTRQFLSVVVPALRNLRPMIEAGSLILAPYRSFRYSARLDVGVLGAEVSRRLVSDPVAFSNRFDPTDLAVEDNVRGFFVVAGGNREEQIAHAISDAVEYFAGECAFALSHGANYVAPFGFEEFACRAGLEDSLTTGTSDHVVRALLRSKLPAFVGLAPATVASVRDDENFAGFRDELYVAYRDAPLGADQAAIDEYMAEVENTRLTPRIQAAVDDPDRGPIALAKKAAGFGFRVGASLLVGTAAGASLAGQAAGTVGLEAANTAWNRLRARSSTPDPARSIWRTLGEHGRTVESQLEHVEVSQRRREPYWGIPSAPSLNFTVSSGMILTDHVSRQPTPSQPGGRTARTASARAVAERSGSSVADESASALRAPS